MWWMFSACACPGPAYISPRDEDDDDDDSRLLSFIPKGYVDVQRKPASAPVSASTKEIRKSSALSITLCAQLGGMSPP